MKKDEATKREGARVARIAAGILDDMPGYGYMRIDDDGTWEKWEEALRAVRSLAMHLDSQAVQIRDS